MNLTPEHQAELAKFPVALRALIDAELAVGNIIEEIGHSHPAPPVGAFVKFTQKVTTRARASGDGLKFYERNTSLYSGEFYDDKRFFFVLEPANPPPPEPDMDAIRKAHEPKPDPIVKLAEREVGSYPTKAIEQTFSLSEKATKPSDPVATVPPTFTHHENTTGWTRVLHFSTNQPPHLVQFGLERELMVLFLASRDGNQLQMNATAHVNGARYDFELRFVAALKRAYHFSLHTEASWADADKTHHDYFRKTSDSWFKLWTREFQSAAPPDLKENIVERYERECAVTFHAQKHLDSVAAVQRAIITGMKSGGTFGTSHKEGGTNISWRVDHFIRSDYGDYPDTKIFRTESDFLQMLWSFCQFEVTRHVGKQGLTELEKWKLILRRMSNVNPPHPDDLRGRTGTGIAALASAAAFPTTAHAATTMQPLYSTPFAKWLVVGVLILIFAGLAAWQFVSIKSTGTPLGAALRTETHVFQLILTQESYLPSLHRNPAKNRFRLDLLVIALADPARQESFTLIRQQQANVATPMTKILGMDGDVVWIQALDTFAVNLRTKRVAREADLRKANPELELFLNSARSEFKDRFLAVSPDWSYAYEFSGETLKANACAPPERGNWLSAQGDVRLERSLCSGGVIGANDWIAVATPEDAKGDFKLGLSLSRDFSPGEKDRNRQLYRGTADYRFQRPPIQSFARLNEKEYRAATFLRTKPDSPILRASNPDSVFLLHRTGEELFAPYSVTRLALDGKELWTAPTGLGRLEQVLPGENIIVLKGERTPVPNKVPEPILVAIDAQTGRLNTISLWR